MSSPVITVENLSKAYRIGLKEEIPDTIVGAMTGWLRAPLRNWKRLRSLDTGKVASCQLPVASNGHEESSSLTTNNSQLTTNPGNGKPSSLTPDTRHLTRHPGVRDQDSGDSRQEPLTPDPCRLTPVT